MATPELPQKLNELAKQANKQIEAGNALTAEWQQAAKEALNQAKNLLHTAKGEQLRALQQGVDQLQQTLKDQLAKHPEIANLLTAFQQGFHERCMAMIAGAENTKKGLGDYLQWGVEKLTGAWKSIEPTLADWAEDLAGLVRLLGGEQIAAWLKSWAESPELRLRKIRKIAAKDTEIVLQTKDDDPKRADMLSRIHRTIEANRSGLADTDPRKVDEKNFSGFIEALLAKLKTANPPPSKNAEGKITVTCAQLEGVARNELAQWQPAPAAAVPAAAPAPAPAAAPAPAPPAAAPVAPAAPAAPAAAPTPPPPPPKP